MKKFILMLALIFLVHATTKAQQGDMPTIKTGNHMQSNKALLQGTTFLNSNYFPNGNGPAKDYDFYKHRSRTQRIIGLSLLGAGLVCGVSALISSGNYQYVSYEDAQRHDRTVTTLFILSAATGIVSIPFMVMAHASKNKARASLSNQKTFIPGKANNYITGITVSIPVGK